MEIAIRVVEDYEVDEETIALLPSYRLEYSTIAIDMNRAFGVRKTAMQLLKTACLDGGADYEGRRKSVLHKMGNIHKTPIPVDPKKYIYTFPTHAANHPDCAWLFLHHIRDVKEHPHNPRHSLVSFSNGYETEVKASRASILKQIERTSRCLVIFSRTFPMPTFPFAFFNNRVNF